MTWLKSNRLFWTVVFIGTVTVAYVTARREGWAEGYQKCLDDLGRPKPDDDDLKLEEKL